MLEAVSSLWFHASQLAHDHLGDWDLTRAVDALDARIDALVAWRRRTTAGTTPDVQRKPVGQDHLVVVTSRVGDGHKVVVVDDATGVATLGLVGAGYPEIVGALRGWADRARGGPTPVTAAQVDARQPSRGRPPFN